MPKGLSCEEVRLEGVTKRFGSTVAVDHVSFVAQKGELTTLLGPSGCGKTTTLRLIGGFLDADEGEIYIGARKVNLVPASRRPTRTVFQNYALFPHMSVSENVAYGLRVERLKRKEIKARVEEILDIVGLGGLGSRQPGQLSGGQQQRVAFARALVTRPQVLLLDEPLSNLDAKLRIHMREEIRRLQQEVGITTIYVTHDQEEALSLSDRVIVMNQGRLEQNDRPHQVYERSATRFVAEFIGLSNMIPVEILCGDGQKAQVSFMDQTLDLHTTFAVGSQALMIIRPEQFEISLQPQTGWIGAEILSVAYQGALARYKVQVGEMVLMVDQASPRGGELPQVGSTLYLVPRADQVHLLPA